MLLLRLLNQSILLQILWHKPATAVLTQLLALLLFHLHAEFSITSLTLLHRSGLLMKVLVNLLPFITNFQSLGKLLALRRRWPLMHYFRTKGELFQVPVHFLLVSNWALPLRCSRLYLHQASRLDVSRRLLSSIPSIKSQGVSQEFLVPLLEQTPRRLGGVKVLQGLLAQIVCIYIYFEQAQEIILRGQRILHRPDDLTLRLGP